MINLTIEKWPYLVSILFLSIILQTRFEQGWLIWVDTYIFVPIIDVNKLTFEAYISRISNNCITLY